jgi:hypothetical protein
MKRLSQDKQENIITTIAVIKTNVEYIKNEVTEIKCKLEKDFVTNDQFDPIKKIVYGMVSLVLVAVVGAVLALVIQAK